MPSSGRRDRQLQWAFEVLDQGLALAIEGERGSGRSTFCRRIRDRFRDRESYVLEVRGLPAFRTTPLSALAVALGGALNVREASGWTLAGVIGQLVDVIPKQRSLIVIDDWDDLDEATWGILCELRRQLQLPMVLSRRTSGRRAATPGSLSALDGLLSLELRPMRLGELEIALADHLGGEVETSTLARIFAAAGGNVGAAIAACDAARLTGTLVEVAGTWTARGDLWSEALRADAETLLERLAPPQLDLLETLAALGATDLALFPEEDRRVLEELEHIGLVEGFVSGEQTMVAVRPPLLADYFQHRSHPARSARIRERASAFPASHPREAAAAEARGSHALLIRLVEERQRRELQAAREAWEADPGAASGTAYLRALAAAPGTDEAVRILAADPRIAAAPGAEWTLAHAEWLAYGQGGVDDALALLRNAAERDPEGAPSLLAFAAEIECELQGRVPDLAALPDPSDPALAPGARVRLHRVHALVATVGLRIGEAHRHLDAIRELAPDADDLRTSVIEGHVLLAEEGPLELHHYGTSGLLDAEDRLDAPGIRAYGALCAFADFMLARHTSGSAVVEFAAHLGGPAWAPPFAQLSLFVLDSVSASRQGAHQLAAMRQADAAGIPGPDGPLPAQTRLLSEVQSIADRDGAVAAADRAVAGAAELWEQGRRFSAALACLGALELDPSAERLDAVRGTIDVLDGGFLTALREYGYAMTLPAPADIVAVAERFVAEQRHGAGLALLARALRLARATDSLAAPRLEERIAELSRSIPHGGPEMRRLAVGHVQLSERERHVASLAAQGMSNAEIAAELVLSRRTVENHMGRIMARLGINRRTQLKERLTQIL